MSLKETSKNSRKLIAILTQTYSSYCTVGCCMRRYCAGIQSITSIASSDHAVRRRLSPGNAFIAKMKMRNRTKHIGHPTLRKAEYAHYAHDKAS